MTTYWYCYSGFEVKCDTFSNKGFRKREERESRTGVKIYAWRNGRDVWMQTIWHLKDSGLQIRQRGWTLGKKRRNFARYFSPSNCHPSFATESQNWEKSSAPCTMMMLILSWGTRVHTIVNIFNVLLATSKESINWHTLMRILRSQGRAHELWHWKMRMEAFKSTSLPTQLSLMPIHHTWFIQA